MVSVGHRVFEPLKASFSELDSPDFGSSVFGVQYSVDERTLVFVQIAGGLGIRQVKSLHRSCTDASTDEGLQRTLKNTLEDVKNERKGTRQARLVNSNTDAHWSSLLWQGFVMVVSLYHFFSLPLHDPSFRLFFPSLSSSLSTLLTHLAATSPPPSTPSDLYDNNYRENNNREKT